MGDIETPEAEFVKMDRDEVVVCLLCPRHCRIEPGQAGFCLGRRNRDGVLMADNYGRVASLALDPIEKKPLYHFSPGSVVVSLGTLGCNLNCSFCQNWQLSHPDDPGSVSVTRMRPEDVARVAREHRSQGCIGVAYTYSEPVIWYEFVRDTSALVSGEGLCNILVTNGFLNCGPWRRLLENVDACNIDVKGFNAEFYRRECAGELDIVKRNVEIAVEMGVHVEVTTLLIPGANDDLDELRQMVQWLSGVDPGIPLHLSRYYPHRRMRRPATPIETLHRVRDLAREKLEHVYLGNVLAGQASDTYCGRCGQKLIARMGYRVDTSGVDEDGCAECGHPAGIAYCDRAGQARIEPGCRDSRTRNQEGYM